MKKPNTKRFHSINFILWVYFLVFAVFILLLTWVFQVALLRTFYSREAENDLDVIGGQVSERIRFYMSMEPAISGETGGKEAFSALIGEGRASGDESLRFQRRGRTALSRDRAGGRRQFRGGAARQRNV